ncbi:MAG: AI-2E family transporter [Candidatus Berkiellales bacterium]
MFKVVKNWGQKYLSDPQAILLLFVIGALVALVLWMGKILAPVIASIVIAYILQWFANILISWRVPRLAAVLIVYSGFMGLFLCAIFILWPVIWQQLLKLYEEIPSMMTSAQHFLYLLPDKFPEFLTKETVDGWVASFLMQLKQSGKMLFTVSVATLPSLIAMVIYIVLVPIMAFFFLKDNQLIRNWLVSFLPTHRPLLTKVVVEMNQQIGNYIRGKVAEVFIVGIAMYIAFYAFGMHYAMLVSVLVGLSVLIPYVGAAIVTIPVIFVAFFQWGFGPEFGYLLLTYGIVQTIDGTVIVPLLFSGIVKLHPLAIIVAVLVFGGWWGFWGVFFAIPLASLVKAVIEAWPRAEVIANEQ